MTVENEAARGKWAGDTSAAPADLIHHLPSILERLNAEKLFVQVQPLEVELGCGDASFLAEYARRHPERNFIGVERLLGRLRKLDRKGRRAGLMNLRGVRIESSYFLEYLLPRHSISALHIYFPDPWPKKRHHRRDGSPQSPSRPQSARPRVRLRLL